MIKLTISSILLILMSLSPVVAQSLPGSAAAIRLEVADQEGKGIEATVRIQSLVTGIERRFRTNGEGVVEIEERAPARCRLEIGRDGFASQSVIIDLKAGGIFSRRIVLGLAALSFSVEVSASTPISGANLEEWEVATPVHGAGVREIEAIGAVDISDLLNRRLRGVSLNEIQGNPFQTDLNYRGYTASPLLGTPQGISVYFDGVRLNEPFGDIVSWDLIPRGVISEVSLLPGSNPLFGLNTLGGALAIRSKDGQSNQGTSIEVSGGSFGRLTGNLEYGGSNRRGFHWYLASNLFFDDGWRESSPTNVRQFFGKGGWQNGSSQIGLTLVYSNNAMVGNGLQEARLLARDYHSIYTLPDITTHRSPLAILNLRHAMNSRASLSANLYYRSIRSATLNGDLNEASLDQSLYNLSANDKAALASAGYKGYPESGANASNTPFPYWRCIAQSLQRDEPAEKCNGLLNRTRSGEYNFGASGQLSWSSFPGGERNQATVGGGFDQSRIRFRQTSQLGYLAPNRSVVGVDSYADGVTGGTIDGEPYDTRVDLDGRISTYSLYFSDTLAIRDRLTLSFAGRYNGTSIENRDRIDPSSGPGSLNGSHRFDRFNPSLGLTFRSNNHFNFYGSYAEGNRAPTSVELGCANPDVPCRLPNSMTGDPPLRQVVTRTFEAGLRSSGEGRFSWHLGLFRGENQNDILFVASEQTGFGFSRNFGRTRRQGGEADIDLRLGRVRIGGNYSLIDATFRSSELVNGESNSSNDAPSPGLEGVIKIAPGAHIPLIPRHTAKLFTDLQITSRLLIDLGLQKFSRSFARGNENNLHKPDGKYYLGEGVSPGYTVAQLGARYRINRHVEFFLRSSNLFNRRYYSAAQLGPVGIDAGGNFMARPFAAVNGQYPLLRSTFLAPGAPRGIWGGIKIRL